MLDTARRAGKMGGSLLKANATRLDTPVKLNWALTYWCQYKCKTCNIWKRKPVDELSTDEVLAVVKNNPSPSWLDVTGGEIFLRQDLPAIFDAIVEGWNDLFLLHFPTNGFLTKPVVDLATRLTKSRVPNIVITVSIDGDQALNDDIRGIKGGFDRQLETLRALRALPGVHAVAGMTLSQYNLGKVEETFAAVSKACPGLTMTDFHVNFAQVSDHYYGNGGDKIVAPRASALGELQSYRARRGSKLSAAGWLEGAFLSKLESYLQTGRTPMPCHSLRSSCFIDPWGTVFPCITYNRPIGRLRETGMRLAPIWEAAQTREIQAEIWKGSCPQCWTACEAYQTILGNLI